MSIQFISDISWPGVQPVEQSQLLEKRRLLLRQNISLDPKALTITTSAAYACSEDVFLCLRCGIKSGLLMVPAPSPSFTRGRIKKICSPDPPQAAASYLWCCTEQMWSGHFQKQI